MNCINLKQKLNRNLYCKYNNKEINIKDCSNCEHKIFKKVNSTERYSSLQSSTDKLKIKCIKKSTTRRKKTPSKKSNKLAKLERKRFSIIYHDLSKCCECGLKTGDYDTRLNMYTQVEKNEVFSGSYRRISMEDGMVAPFCIFCHKLFHKNSVMNLYYKVKFQKEYMKNHTLDEFIARYGQNYIYKLEQKKRSKGI